MPNPNSKIKVEKNPILIDLFNMFSEAEDFLNKAVEFIEENRRTISEAELERLYIDFNALVDAYDNLKTLLETEIGLFDDLPLWYDINDPNTLLLDGIIEENPERNRIRRFNPRELGNNNDDVFEL